MRKHLVNVSPWLLGAACALLALIIGVFALTNYKREKVLMQEALLRQADVVVRIVNSSMRKSIFDALRNGDSSPDFIFSLQRAVEQAQEQDGVDSVFVVDDKGKIYAGSSIIKFEDTLKKDDKRFIKRLFQDKETQFLSRRKHLKNIENDVFQFSLIINLETLKKQNQFKRPQRMMMNHHNRRGNNRSDQLSKKLEEILGDRSLAILINLDLDRFGTGIQKQKQQLIVLSIILLLVGSGGWLSLLTLQGLRGSQTRLAQLSAFNERLVSTIPIGIIGVGQDKQIKTINDKAVEIINISKNSVLFCDYREVLPELVNQIRSSLTDNINIEIRKSNNQVIQLLAADIQNENNEDDGFVILLQDLTDQRTLEQELQKSVRLASLGKVAAGVAHELRNPLSSIKGLGKLLQTRFEIDSQDRQTADVLVAEIDRLNRSIGELLDYAKPQEIELSKINLKESIEKAVQLVQFDAESLGINIDVLENKEDVFVKGNSDKLNQVFLNLLLNSVQAIHHENGLISIEYDRVDNNVIVTVTDNGLGVDSSILDKVFDPYFTTKNEGTGLGLSMCSKIIEEHGGEIKISSDKGQGCSISIELQLG